MKSGRTKRELTGGGLIERLKARGRTRREGIERLSGAAVSPLAARNDILPQLEVINLRISEFCPSSRKLRKNEPGHIRAIANSIARLGFCQPILIGQDNVPVDGELRLAAARLVGLERIPCIRIHHLSKPELRVLRLALNRLGEKGEWNFDELKLELEELIVLEAPIEVSGFTLDEIDNIRLDETPNAIERGPLAPDIGAVAVARLGDVFQLGRHRVINGSATDPAVVSRVMQELMPGARREAPLVFTDQPYNVPIKGHVTGGAHREFVMASGEMTDEEFLAFNIAWMEAALPFLREGGVLGTFIDWRGQPSVHAAAVKLGLTPFNLVVWNKPNAGMGNLYRSKHELLPLFKKGYEPNINNVNLGKRGRWRSNVWDYPGASSFGSDARRGLQDHPTVKPTAMLKDALLDLTHRGDVVIDPFLGSGSTLIAAEETGRVCCGVELDPLYVDVIVRRFEAATKVAAVLVETGETFAEVAARRAAGAAVTPVLAETSRSDIPPVS